MIYSKNFYALCFMFLLAGCGGGAGNNSSSGVTVSGTIIASANTIADKDTQDTNAPRLNNSIPSNAQSLSNPGTAGGNLDFSTQDKSDYYQVFLRKNDAVVLQIVDARLISSVNNDLQFKLFILNNIGSYDPVATVNDPATPQTESFTVSADGDYLIQVEAVSGSSNYVLNVGSNVAVFSQPAEIVPGEVLVKFKETLPGLAVQKVLPATLSVSSSDKILKNVFRYTIKKASTLSGVQTNSKSVSVEDTWALIRSLNQRADVVYAEPNYRYRALAVTSPNDPLFPLQWNIGNINLSQGWQQVPTTGVPVTVAVLDSGIRFNHPDLSNQFINDNGYSTGHVGYDFLIASESFDGDGPDDNPTDPGDTSLTGSTFHGTLVSGIVAAETHNATGVAGVANTALVRLLPLRILSSTGGRSSEICQAITFAAGLSSAGGKTLAKPVDVINMSFGTTSFSQTLLDCITQARAAGVIMVAAAGNESTSLPLFPASYDGVISVSATTLSKKLAGYSNTGSAIDIAAPGGDAQDLNADGNPDGILTTSASKDSIGTIGFGYRFASGTSMSAPHVAGVFALMKWIYPALTPVKLNQWLVAGLLTEDLTPQISGADNQFGYGLLNARTALTQANDAAKGITTVIPPLLISTPRGLSFGATIDSQHITLSNAGGGSLLIPAPTITYLQGSNWLNLTANSGSIGLGGYVLSVNRNALAPGNYAATVTFTSNANTLIIPISMNIPTIDFKADTGFLYVLLTNSTGTQTLHSVSVQAVNGQYNFSIPNVSPGSYQLFVGTDMDQDNTICDPGEACGAYAALDRILNISVGSNNVSGLKINSAFIVNQGSFSLSLPQGIPLPSSTIENSLP